MQSRGVKWTNFFYTFPPSSSKNKKRNKNFTVITALKDIKSDTISTAQFFYDPQNIILS